MTRVAAALAALLLAAVPGCKDEEVLTPTRYLERPNAIDFLCVGPPVIGGTTLTAMPAYACAEGQPGADERFLIGLLSNSARSEVAVVDLTTGALVDLANQNPGYGFIPVGRAPLVVRTTGDGCAGYVANQGSCDISGINVNRVLHAAGFPINEDSAPGPPVTKLAIRTASGRLLARPHDLLLRRGPAGDLPPIRECVDVRNHRGWVSYPTCGIVAEVDLDTGQIVRSVRVDATGATDAGIDPACPRECADFAGDGVDGGTTSTARPGPLLLSWEGDRLFVGLLGSPHVVVIDVDPATGVFGSSRVLPLAEEAGGVRRLRQSIYTTVNQWHFLYVVARSGIVHVFDADSERECETNPDPRDPVFDDRAWEANKGCLPLGDPSTPARAPGVATPGIVVPGERIVVDVGFSEIDPSRYTDTSLTALHPFRLSGTFAYVVTMDGLTYLVNVDEEFEAGEDPVIPGTLPIDWRRQDGIHALLSHQVRNAVDTRPTEIGVANRPRPEDGRAQDLEVDGQNVAPEERELYDRVAFVVDGGAEAEPDIAISDPYRVRSEVWTLAYQGTLPRTRRSTGQIVSADVTTAPPGQAEFRDDGIAFCGTNVRDEDLVVLAGCDSDRDCAPTYFCYRSFLQTRTTLGVCIAEEGGTALTDHCERAAVSRREYRVERAEDGRLLLGRLEAPELGPCPDAAGFCCEDGGQGEVRGVDEGGVCYAAPLPDEVVPVPIGDGNTRMASCFEGLVRYEIRVGNDAYLLSGAVTGTQGHSVPDAADGGYCIPDPSVSPLLDARVPRAAGLFENNLFAFSLDLAADGTLSQRYGYEISFEIIAGFDHRRSDVSARLPSVVESGPDGQLYVIDQGDDNAIGGLRGQVLRVNAGDLVLDTSFVVR